MEAAIGARSLTVADLLGKQVALRAAWPAIEDARGSLSYAAIAASIAWSRRACCSSRRAMRRPWRASTLLCIEPGVADVVNIDDAYPALMAAACDRDPGVDPDPEPGLVILYTSGTTGLRLHFRAAAPARFSVMKSSVSGWSRAQIRRRDGRF